MSTGSGAPAALDDQVRLVLDLLEQGRAPAEVETTQVDVKEEPGRRDRRGRPLPASRENEEAAEYLAGEMACMANTPGGGAIVLGVSDDGTRIGTGLDPEWLRHRIFQLTERKLTVSARPLVLDGCRLLVLSTPEAWEPIPYRGRYRWRLNDNCVDIDLTSWNDRRLHRGGFDWSAQPSSHSLTDVDQAAIEIARRYMRENGSGSGGGSDLATATSEDMIRRLNLVDTDDRLTNAGSLLFVGTPEIGIDYIRREVPGGDSTHRVPRAGRPWSDGISHGFGPFYSRREVGSRPLLQQFAAVEQAMDVANAVVHVPDGFAVQQINSIPPRAMREALVNGIVHRDWNSRQPTTVEHVGSVLTVTSPGGFIGGVAPSNIITHPAAPRYRSLAEAMAAMRLGEREGIGVDRMTAAMLALGHPPPVFSEVDGPYVRVTLTGGEPDREWLDFIGMLDPSSQGDLDLLLLVDRLLDRGWADAGSAAPVLQRPVQETLPMLQRVVDEVQVNGMPIMENVHGSPDDHPLALRLSSGVRRQFARKLGRLSTRTARESVMLDYARARGRISSTEAADLAGVTASHAAQMLAALADAGHLVGSRPNRRGRGFHYVPAT
jgi:ATP-dependent DNA helicase RecG